MLQEVDIRRRSIGYGHHRVGDVSYSKGGFLSTLREFIKSAQKWLTKDMGSRRCLQKVDGFVGEKWD